MTREEAIKHLEKWLDERMWRCFGEEDRKAIRMAIEALSADSDCNNCKEYGSYKCTRCDGEIYHKTD